MTIGKRGQKPQNTEKGKGQGEKNGYHTCACVCV